MKPLSLALLLVSFGAYAQSPPTCDTPDHRAFDSWIGEWVVHDTAGTYQGANTIEPLENGCILSEYWRGAKGSTGRSYNYYDRADSTWNQLWIDNSGNNLNLKGKASKDKMTLESKVVQGQKGPYKNRITWTLRADGSVSQQWDAVSLEGKQLATLFLGIYTKKKD